MRQKITFLIFLSCLNSVSFAQGVADGGGGKSVVCRDGAGQITSAELLDLYEARSQWTLPYPRSITPIETQLAPKLMKIHRILPKRADFIVSEVDRLLSSKTVLAPTVKLTPVQDSFEIIAPKGCGIEQLANYRPNQALFIDGEIWSKLDPTNQTALMIHEAVYRSLRDDGETASSDARRLVGLLFSGLRIPGVEEGIPTTAIKCRGNVMYGNAQDVSSELFAFNDSDGNLVLQFTALEGRPMLTQSRISLGKIDVGYLRGFGLVNPILKELKQFENVFPLNSVMDQGLPLLVRYGARWSPWKHDNDDHLVIDVTLDFQVGTEKAKRFQSVSCF